MTIKKGGCIIKIIFNYGYVTVATWRKEKEMEWKQE